MYKFHKIIFLLLLLIVFSNSANAINYQAIVEGKIIDSKIRKIKNQYITEYKLKTKDWIYNKPEIKKTKYLTIKILGADLKEKGIVIKPSFAPDSIPINKEAIFFLENTKKNQPGIFTLSKGGIINIIQEN